MIHHITRATRHLIFWSLIVVALGMTGVRLALVGIEGYKVRLAAHVGALVGVPVKIGRLGARMRGFSPEVVLNDIDIASVLPTKPSAIELQEIRFGVNLLQTAFSRDLLASSWVTLVGAKLTVKRNSDGKLSIAGLKAGGENPLWLLETGKYEVIDSDITWQDELRHGRALTFESVDLALMNEGSRHRLNVLMRLPKKLGKSLKGALDFDGDLFDPQSLQGRAYLEGSGLNLPEWITFDLPMALNLDSGNGDLRLWSDWQHARLAGLTGQVDLHDLQVHRPGMEAFAAKQLRGRFQARLGDGEWRLDVNPLALTTEAGGKSKNWPEAVFSVKSSGDALQANRRIALYVENLDLQQAALAGRFLLPSDHPAARFLGLQGQVRDFALFADNDLQAVAVKGDFADVGLAAAGNMPGFEHLSGHVHGNQHQGALKLSGNGAVFNAPNLFRAPLALDRVEGVLAWRQTAEGWSFSSPSLVVDARDVHLQNRLRFDLPRAEGKAFIDLQSEFSCADAKVVSQYFPAQIMRADVVAWLDQAFVGGRVPKGGFLLYGNPADFPYTAGNGVFEVVFDVADLELSYQPGWPHVGGTAAEVVFYQDALHAAVTQGTAHGVVAKQATVDIPHLGAAENLLINGKLEGGIDQALAFVQNSPLAARADAFLRVASAQGNSKIDLDLDIPLRKGGQYRTEVTAHLDKAELLLKSPKLRVRDVSGSIKFDDHGVSAENLSANVLNRPVKARLSTSEHYTGIDVDGRVDLADLRKPFDLPWLDFAEGETAYRLALRLPHQSGKPTVSLRSDLNGVRLDLPDMLAKTAKQPRAFDLTLTLADDGVLPIELSYGNDFSAALAVDVNKRHIESGHVLMGDGKATPRREPGLKLEVNRDTLQLHDWLALAGARTQGGGPDVRQLTVHGGQAFWGQQALGRFDLDLRRAERFWEGGIDSPLLQGRVKLPLALDGQDKIELRLARLDVSALADLKADAGSQGAGAETMPLLAVSSDHTYWKSADLGRLVMNSERVPNGLLFDRVELQGADQKLALTGVWKKSAQASETHAKGRLELLKGGSLVARLGISQDLIETSGEVDFDLRWPGAPYRFTLAGLQGAADVKLNSGRILSIEPGFGRVLGILAMAQWFKRLQLDFRDVYQEGLTFNSINGHFRLGQGKAVTDDLVVDAIPAKISINGETDFVNRTVDHLVHVTPKSAEAVPIAGTIMSKFAALIDKTLTGTEHEGFFFGSQYLVKGAWGNTDIRTLHDKEGLLQKTWSGITDFPWLPDNNE